MLTYKVKIRLVSDKTFMTTALNKEDLCNKIREEYGIGNVLEIHWEEASNDEAPIDPPRRAA